MGSIVLQSTRTDGLSDWAKDTGRSLDATEETEGLSDEVKETDKLLGATEMEAGGRLENCVEGQRLLKGRGRRNDIVHDSRKKMRIDVAAGILN